MRIQTRIQKLERVLPLVQPEDPESERVRLALQNLSDETLEALGLVLRAEATGRPLTEPELETYRIFRAAVAAVPLPVSRSTRRRR
jgi:hypothetical protein